MRILLSCIVAFLAFLSPHVVHAQDYPKRTIKLVVPYAAGGGTDVAARFFAREIEKISGNSVIVENRAGAGGMIGTMFVINAEADGYTLLVGDNSTNSFIPALAKTPRYNPTVDLTPISLLLDVPNVLVVHPSVQANNMAELIALSKSKPGALNAGTAGVGSFAHVATELINVQAGTSFICVAYKGGAEALPALLKGEVQIEGLRDGAQETVKSGTSAARGTVQQLRDFVRGLHANSKTKEAAKALTAIVEEIDKIHPLEITDDRG